MARNAARCGVSQPGGPAADGNGLPAEEAAHEGGSA